MRAASVTIHRVRTGKGSACEAFSIADYGTGTRRLRKVSDLKEAKTEALRIATALGNQDTHAADLSYRDAATLVRLRETIGPFGVTLVAAADLFAEAAGLVGVHRIVEACRGFAQKHPAAREKHSLSKVADDYYQAKDSQGRGARHLQDIMSRLGRFVHDHPGRNVGELTGPVIQAWLDGLRGTTGATLSAQTRRNFATILSGFFGYCRRQGLITDNPVRDVERVTIRRKGDPEFYTPEEAHALLDAAPRKRKRQGQGSGRRQNAV